MRHASGFNGLVEENDVEAVRYNVHQYPSGRSYWSLYLSEQVSIGTITAMDDAETRALSARYLQRVADQALALIAEIGTASAADRKTEVAGE